MSNPWIVKHHPRPHASIRLFCFPFAGAGASAYRPWSSGLPDVEVCAVQLPGRENRLREAPMDNLHAIADALDAGIGPLLVGPYAFFGHSFGSWVAFELARRIAHRGAAAPEHLFVSGRRAPRVPARLPDIHRRSDAEFLDALSKRYGGLPPEIMAHAELVSLLLPALRADFSAAETYVYHAAAPLTCPISVLGGAEDASTDRGELDAWRDETSSSCVVDTLPGGHFFIESARGAVLDIIGQRLTLRLGSFPRG